MKQIIYTTLLLLSLFSITFSVNKIQYIPKDWKVVKSDHFDVYYFNENIDLAKEATFFLERAFSNLSSRLDYYPINKTPIVIYSTPAEFQRTNVIGGSIGEGTGGFTEIFKKRVVVPFDGDFFRFRHVLHHELVHAFFYSYFGKDKNPISAMKAVDKLPLWLHEGLAEYFSIGWDEEADNVMRNIVIDGQIDNNILSNSGSFLMYKAGQNFALYLSQKYGEDKLISYIKAISKDDIEKATKEIYFKELKDLKKEWAQNKKKHYWKDVDKFSLIEIGKALTEHFEDLTSININPSLSPNDSLVAYFSDRYDNISLVIKNIRTGEPIDIIGNEFASYHDSYHPFYSRIGWNYIGDELYYSALSDNQDAIFRYSIREEKIIAKYKFENIKIIRNPSISPIGEKVIFEGVKNGYPDIFEYNLSTKKLTQLTSDMYKESDPVYSPDGRYIAFTVQNAKSYDDIWNYKSQYNLVLLDQQTQEFKVIFSSKYEISRASFDDNPNFLYILSASNLINNILKIDIKKGTSQFITNYYNGLFSYSKSEKGFIFNYYNNFGYDISYIKADSLPKIPAIDTLHMDSLSNNRSIFKIDTNWTVEKFGIVDSIVSDFKDSRMDKLGITELDTAHRFVDYPPNSDNNLRIEDYKTRFTLDLLSFGLSYDPINGYGAVGYAQLSDMLGDHKLNLSFNATDYSSLYDIDVSLTYAYLAHRNQFYLGGTLNHDRYFSVDTLDERSASEYGATLKDKENLDQTYRLFLLSNYPINKYKSFINSVSFYGLNQFEMIAKTDSNDSIYYDLIASDDDNLSFIDLTSGISFDNRLFSLFGPVSGTNYGAFASFYKSINGNDNFGELNLYYKKYIRMVRTYTLALNATSGMSTAFSGNNYKQYFLGGMDMALNDNSSINRGFKKGELLNSQLVNPLRGYSYYDIQTPNYLLTNMEFRFPFIVNLMFYRPIPLFFQYIGGAVFLDYAYAWNSMNTFIYEDNSGDTWLTQVKNNSYYGYGVGARLNFAYYVMKFDWALERGEFLFKTKRFYFTLSGEF